MRQCDDAGCRNYDLVVTDLVLFFAVVATSYVWLALEVVLLVRDRVRGMGSTARDRASRRLNFLAIVVTIVLAEAVGIVVLVNPQSALRLPGSPGAVVCPSTGLAIMWLGLVVRLWAILVLGRAFRTTVEVHAGQQVVERGPYRWIRHPSYTGLLLLAIGFGLAMDSWISLLVALVIPILAVAWRISVEEHVLVETLGVAYERYRTRTKRLIPYVW